ncbi:MAG: PilT/PilU family type 4a pilus ATPase [Candidatus Omnitrophota bacterium]
MNITLDSILLFMTAQKASDLIIKVGSPICIRINGALHKHGAIVTDKDLEFLLKEIKEKGQDVSFEKEKEMVLAFGIKDIGRFRASIFRQRGTFVIVIRSVNTHIPTFEELNLPAKILEELCKEKRGLILVTGTTGSGKSTTVASMIEYINNSMSNHIITLEDPIEFIFKDKRSIISQREIRIDTDSFQKALEYIMLETPDTIFIGDIRNIDIMSTAMTAAETGQLVIANLHTINATHTIERILNFFQPHQHNEIRMQLSLLLKGIASLRLIPLKDGSGRIPACEVLIPTPTIVELIREGKLDEIEYYIKNGALYGMQTFDQALVAYYKKGLITEETALNYADRKNEVVMSLKELH